MTKCRAASLLLLAFVISTSLAGPLSFVGKENVFKYSIKIGKTVASSFKQGLLLNLDVVARKKVDETFSIKITNVEVRCHENKPIDKKKYEELETLLKVPFDFNPKEEHGLIIYAPDSTDTESANIKRGLVNLLEFYNADTKKVEKVAGKAGPSGTCPEHEMKKQLADVEEDLRFPSLDGNCTAGKPHQYVKKNFVSHRGTYCELEPKVSRSIAYRVTHSKDGSDVPKILVKSTESIRLQSIFRGLFDEVQAHTTLQLIKVQDAAPEEALTTTTTKSCLEIKLKSSKPHDHSAEQVELLEKAQGAFKMFSHCLKRMDENPHLEEQTVASTVAVLTYTLKHLNKESLVKLFYSLDTSMQPHFFQILALEPGSEAIDAVADIYLKVWENPDANPYEVSEAVPNFFESLDHKSKGVTMKDVAKFPTLIAKMEESDKTNIRLKQAIILAGSGLMYEACVRKGKQDDNCPVEKEVLEKVQSKDPENKDETATLLKLKAISNMKIPSAIPFIKSLIDNQENSVFVRSQAAWTLLHFARRNSAEVKPVLMKLFYDRKEDHEIRIIAYLGMVMSNPSDLQSAVQYLIDNHDNEDRQVVSYVVASVSSLKSLKYPEGSKCRPFAESLRSVESMVSSVADKLGPKSLFDSSVYTFASKDNTERLLVSWIAAKNDIIPRTLFIMIQDGLQERSYAMHSVSDALLYNNLVQMKEAYEKMKKDNKIAINEDVKKQLEAIFDKVKGKPTDTQFSMVFAKTVDGSTIFYDKYSKPDELIQRILSLVVSNDKYVRTFKKFNELAVKTHTETGLKVKFLTAQSAVSSFELPQFLMGQPGRSGIPFALRYAWKFVSRTAYLSIVDLPAASFRYVTGRVSDKHMSIPRNVTVHVIKKQSDKLAHIVAKVKSDPLVGKKENDLVYRAMSLVDGNLETPSELDKIVRKDKKALDSHTHLHKYFGYGLVVSKSVDYTRPVPWKTPLSRFCPVYQEMETENKPYRFKVALTASESGSSFNNYEVNIVHGIKDDNYVRMMGITVTNPSESASKSVRFSAGVSTNTQNPDKRLGLLSYENYVKNIFVRGSFETSMPSEAVSIPSVSKATDEWKNVYGNQKINIKAAFKYTASNRTEFGNDDIEDLLRGLGSDVDATGEAELYRTAEQIDLFKKLGSNAADDVTDENMYSAMIRKSQAHPMCTLRTWDTLLKFHGMKGSVKMNKPLPSAIVDLQRRINLLLSGVHWNEMSFDMDDKAPEGSIMFWANSTVDSSRSDMGMKDKNGALRFENIRSYAMQYMRPSASPIKVYKSKTLNKPVCSIISEGSRHEIESFSGRDIMTDELADDCEYLLTSNCRGSKNFAITYTKKNHTYKILFDNKHEIVITGDSLTLDGEEKAKTDSITVTDDMIYAGRYKGIFGVALPNMVEVIREVGSPNAYIRASQLFRGRLCGLCGSHDGNSVTDDVSSFGEFGITGTCPA